MTLQDFEDIFVLWLSGLVKMKNKKEIWWKDCFGDITVEFTALNPNKAVVRSFWENGSKHIEENYKNGMLNGKRTVWYEDGSVKQQDKYENDEQIDIIIYQ